MVNKRHVLIVEDDPELARAINDFLRLSGYETTLVENGLRAVHAAQEKKPAVVIMDVQLPGLSGIDACQRIKGDTRLKDTAVIMLTALCDLQDIQRSLAAGAVCYINKPVDPDRLVAKIQKYTTN